MYKMAPKYYTGNRKVLKEDSRKKYRSFSEKDKNNKKEISKRKMPHEYWFKWKTKTISNKFLCLKDK